jgi:hypothetical protein
MDLYLAALSSIHKVDFHEDLLKTQIRRPIKIPAQTTSKKTEALSFFYLHFTHAHFST